MLRPNKTSSRRLEKDVGFTFWGRQIYDVLKTPDLRRLEDVQFRTSWWRRIYNVLKTSNLNRLEDVWFTTSWGCLIYDVLRTPDLSRLEDVQFTTSWRRPQKATSAWQRRNDVYATSKEMIFSYFVLSEIFRKC